MVKKQRTEVNKWRKMTSKRKFTTLTATVEPKDIALVEAYAKECCEDNFSQAVRHLLRAGGQMMKLRDTIVTPKTNP